MTRQSRTFSKIIVTSCLMLGVALGSPAPQNIDADGLSQTPFNLGYPLSGPTGLYYTAGDIAAAESGSLFGDGAPLPNLFPTGGLNLLSTGVSAGDNQFLRYIAPPQQTVDDLQVAGQSYFIEPPTTSTTTQKPVFKKRKTRRPITVLAEKSKKQKAALAELEGNNNANNDVFQGNPVPFNPFRQIVNTSFGRKRPSDSGKQERTRSRANAVNQQETTRPALSTAAPAADTNNDNAQKSNDNVNEISAKIEGEPRALGHRRPGQNVRALRPTATVASDDSEQPQPAKGRRVPLRKPRPSFDGAQASADEGADNNAPKKPLRPRPLAKRPRPRPTTTIASPGTETDAQTEITNPSTVSQFQTFFTSPQTAPPSPPEPVVTDARPRVRPARPPGVSRFANANRNTAFTTPSANESGDESPISSPAPGARRRPLRPTTRFQSLTTSTQAPEDVLGNQINDVPSPPVASGRGRGNVGPRPGREGRQGFILRPKPTPNSDVPTVRNVDAPIVAENQEGIRKPLSNRRRKKPTTTIATPSAVSPALTYNQGLVGGVVENNVAPPAPVSERVIPGARRVNPILRSRVTPLPPLPATGAPPSYQVREEQPVPQPVSGSVENFSGPNEYTGPTFQSFRRPSAPAPTVQQQSPFQQAFSGGVVDPNNFVPADPNFFQLPNQPSFYPGGFENSIGVPSNFRSLQQIPSPSGFSARSTSSASDEQAISPSDFSPVASSEKQSVFPSAPEIEDSPVSDDVAAEDNNNNEETEMPSTTTTPAPAPPTKKLSPIKRLQQNRQAAARRLLAPRKPTEKTTVPPQAPNAKPGNNFRKSIVPPRVLMLRPRGKLPGAQVPTTENPVPNDAGENYSGGTPEEKLGGGTSVENINDAATTGSETDNTIPVQTEEKETSTRKPSILEAAKRRRVPPILMKNHAAVQQPFTQPRPKVTTTPATHVTESTTPPSCEDGQRYSKFLKKCITMYKPRAQG